MPYLLVILIRDIINLDPALYVQHLRLSKDISDLLLAHTRQFEDVKRLAS